MTGATPALRAEWERELLGDEAVRAAAVQPSINAGSEGDSYFQRLDAEEQQICLNEARTMLAAALATLTDTSEEKCERCKGEGWLLPSDEDYVVHQATPCLACNGTGTKQPAQGKEQSDGD